MDKQHKPIASLLILISSVVLVSASEICFNSACYPNEPWIRFPFRLQNVQSKQCGYPGFDLTCDSTNLITSLHFQNTQKFRVQAIDYASQEIWLNDPNNCLPQSLLTLNLSGSPFTGVSYQDFTLFNCSSNFHYELYKFNPIACLSGSGYNIVATSSDRAARILFSSCSFVSTVPVPVQWPFYEQIWSSDLSDDIWLTWDAPQCGKCESRGGRCGLKTNSSNHIECKTRHGLPRGARYAISAGAGVPASLFVLGLVCFLCSKSKACREEGHPVNEFTSTHAPQPIIQLGLDRSIIESYPKTVLGESRRLPKPDDNICPICLSEYKPKDTLRTIPTCHHCFHANCIDEWLPLNAACPVCRNNPKQSSPAPKPAPASDDNV